MKMISPVCPYQTRFPQRSTTNRFEREAQANLWMAWLRWIVSSWFTLQDGIILLCQDETWLGLNVKADVVTLTMLWDLFFKYPISWTWQCQMSGWMNSYRSFQHHTRTKFSFTEDLWKGRVQSTPAPSCWERCRLIGSDYRFMRFLGWAINFSVVFKFI